MAITNTVPPLKYDKLYTHISWEDKPVTPIRALDPYSESQETLATTNTTNISTEQRSNLNTLEDIFNQEIIPYTLLVAQPIAWETLRFNAHIFINAMAGLPNFQMNEDDIKFAKILVWAEMDDSGVTQIDDALKDVSTIALSEFGKRFSPWGQNC